MTPNTSRLQTLLLDCLTRPLPDSAPADCERLTAAAWEELREIARIQRVSALLHSRVHRFPGGHPSAPTAVRKELTEWFQQRTMRNLFLFAEFRKLAEALQERQVPVMALKGMHLAAAVYSEIGMREMDDIDILVPRSDLRKAADTLTELGYASREPLEVEFWAERQHHLPRMLNENNTVVEVHWNITWPGNVQALSDPRDLWDRAQAVSIAGCEAKGLGPEDLILHLCIHASYQHMFYTGLRPACDLDATIRCYQSEIDWSLLCQLARDCHWQHGVRLMLRLTQRCLGTRIPESVWRELLPPDDHSALDAAYRMLWTIDSDVSALPRNLAAMWNRPNLLLRLRDLFRTLLPNRFRIAKEFGLSANSPWIWLHFPRYKMALLLRHYHAVRKLQQSDPETRAMALNKSTLMDWLYPE